ncbi:MAG: hypothetical protein ABUL47_08275, partial [Leifsonia sp.]
VFSTLSVVAASSLAGDYVGQVWVGLLVASITGPLPFAIGVFLCFWQIAPIAPVLRLAHVVTRSILGSLVGGAVIWVASLVVQVGVEVSNTPFATPASTVIGKLGSDLILSLFGALTATVQYVPTAVLAGILLWGWLQRHPLDTRVHGALDEV